MELPAPALVLTGLLLAAWTLAGVWAIVSANARVRRADGVRKAARRLARMIDEAPAMPLLVRTDGKIEGPDRLARWFGFDTMPEYLSELAAPEPDAGGAGGDRGLPRAALADLAERLRLTQRTAVPFRMVVTPDGGNRRFALRGALADPQVAPHGAALVWVFDASESAEEQERLRRETAGARADFAALVGLIEAAPLPMWFRGPDGRLRLVNAAYVTAVGAADADRVVAEQIELVEPADGGTAAEIALAAAARGEALERQTTTTIEGQRRSLRVSDLPLGCEGVAGYAVDIQDMEEQARAFRAYRAAQRSLLDRLSIGVALFDGDRRLRFANQPFQRLFALGPDEVAERLGFDRLLDRLRERGRVPEARDFPEWRRERGGWFARREPADEGWSLNDGTHLRIVAQPMPDGGLTLIAEDLTEQLALSATRDTLLRTRTATFDSLAEALSVFAPDGRLQLWNRRFGDVWGLDAALLDTHPRAEDLLTAIAPALARPDEVAAIGKVIRAAALDRRQRAGRIAMADGRTLEYAGVPLPDGNGLLTTLDITDAQKAEDALRDRNAALEEADAVKTRFLATMSYEFRTPLTSIGGFAELLDAGIAGDLGETGREYVAAILASVARLSDQIETVLDLSQSEAGLLPVAREDIPVMEFIVALVRGREGAVEKAGLDLQLRGSKAVGRIAGDRRQLRRALGHLIDNAIAATPAGGRILVDLARQKGELRIVVSDNGRGMDAAMLDAANRAVEPARPPAQKRVGLGLPLARQLIEAHGGTLELASQPGDGTAAIVRLPC